MYQLERPLVKEVAKWRVYQELGRIKYWVFLFFGFCSCFSTVFVVFRWWARGVIMRRWNLNSSWFSVLYPRDMHFSNRCFFNAEGLWRKAHKNHWPAPKKAGPNALQVSPLQHIDSLRLHARHVFDVNVISKTNNTDDVWRLHTTDSTVVFLLRHQRSTLLQIWI